MDHIPHIEHYQDNRVGGTSRRRPLTPPYVRIRIRRFESL